MSRTGASEIHRFWELEALISSGCDLTEALIVMSARRDFAGVDRSEMMHPTVTSFETTHRVSLS